MDMEDTMDTEIGKLSAAAQRVAAYVDNFYAGRGPDSLDRMHRFNDYYLTRSDLQLLIATARRQVQQDTVNRLNDLTPENNGRVRAAVVTDGDAAELCSDDTAHGAGTVVFTIEGELFELCPDCAVRVIDGMLRDGRVVSDSNDLIDVEVYR